MCAAVTTPFKRRICTTEPSFIGIDESTTASGAYEPKGFQRLIALTRRLPAYTNAREMLRHNQLSTGSSGCTLCAAIMCTLWITGTLHCRATGNEIVLVNEWTVYVTQYAGSFLWYKIYENLHQLFMNIIATVHDWFGSWTLNSNMHTLEKHFY